MLDTSHTLFLIKLPRSPHRRLQLNSVTQKHVVLQGEEKMGKNERLNLTSLIKKIFPKILAPGEF